MNWLRRPWVWGVVALLILGGAATALRFAPLFQVEQIAVTGNEQVTADEVLAAAAVRTDVALVTVPVEEVAERIEALDAVASVRVTRDWPDTLRIMVKERRAVGYVASASTVYLVGSDGVLYREYDGIPRELPQLPTVDGGLGDRYDVNDPAAAAFAVASALPAAVRRAVAEIGVDDVRDIRLTFDDGVVVDWGSTAATERKVEIVSLLRERRQWGRAFTAVDVSAPDAPALRNTPVG
jgi:cell division protein FtsQ